MKGSSKYETVIGLEIHAQLLTRSKLFCADSTIFGAPPNTQVSVISLAHPGTLPKINKEAIPMSAVQVTTGKPATSVTDTSAMHGNSHAPGMNMNKH